MLGILRTNTSLCVIRQARRVVPSYASRTISSNNTGSANGSAPPDHSNFNGGGFSVDHSNFNGPQQDQVQEQIRTQQQQPAASPQQFCMQGKIFRSSYELKLDAALKQSIASRTNDQQLMKEAHLEQSIADSLSPNMGGQPLYGKGPRRVRNHQNANNRTQQSAPQITQQSASQPIQQNSEPQPAQSAQQLGQDGQQQHATDDLWERVRVEMVEESSPAYTEQAAPNKGAEYEKWL